MLSPPPQNKKLKKQKKQKKQNKKKHKEQNHGDCKISNGFGFFFFVFLFLFGFLQGALPKESPHIFCWFNDFFNSLLGILPKEYQNIVVFLFVWRCTYEYVQIAAKCEHKKWACYIVNHSTNSMSGGRGGGWPCIYIYIYVYIYIYKCILYFPARKWYFPCQVSSGSISIARPSAWKSAMGQGAESCMMERNIISKVRTTMLAFFTPGLAFCVLSTFFSE